jgi:hypothetical protein
MPDKGGRKKVRIKMLNRRTRMNTGNCKIREGMPRKCVKQKNKKNP